MKTEVSTSAFPVSFPEIMTMSQKRNQGKLETFQLANKGCKKQLTAHFEDWLD
jgi:hypothetical protein